MSKKYEFVEADKIEIGEATLTRIRALRDIPGRGVKAGHLGGYIETEENLPHDDWSWVGKKSRVIGKESRIILSWVGDSTIISSNVIGSAIRDSTVVNSTVSDAHLMTRSLVEKSHVQNGKIRDSIVKKSHVTNSSVRDSVIKKSRIENQHLSNRSLKDVHDHG